MTSHRHAARAEPVLHARLVAEVRGGRARETRNAKSLANDGERDLQLLEGTKTAVGTPVARRQLTHGGFELSRVRHVVHAPMTGHARSQRRGESFQRILG